MNYPVHEMFYTFQGEGSAMGLPAFFVRLFGCPIKCSFCDAAGTWHPQYVPPSVLKFSPSQILDAVQQAEASLVVITGGEPTIFDLEPLVSVLQEAGKEVHLETSGAFMIQGDFDWIVLSPKTAKPPIRDSVTRADEFKLIIEKPSDIGTATQLLTDTGAYKLDEESRNLWLHPEWGQRSNPHVLNAIIDKVKHGDGPYRAGWQLHKLYLADARDSRSRPLVPLGGDLARGF